MPKDIWKERAAHVDLATQLVKEGDGDLYRVAMTVMSGGRRYARPGHRRDGALPPPTNPRGGDEQ
jgi:hypothetical protein